MIPVGRYSVQEEPAYSVPAVYCGSCGEVLLDDATEQARVIYTPEGNPDEYFCREECLAEALAADALTFAENMAVSVSLRGEPGRVVAEGQRGSADTLHTTLYRLALQVRLLLPYLQAGAPLRRDDMLMLQDALHEANRALGRA